MLKLIFDINLLDLYVPFLALLDSVSRAYSMGL